MTDLVFAVVERRPNRLSKEISSELPDARVKTLRHLKGLLELIDEEKVDGIVIDSEEIGVESVIAWLEDHPMTCGVLLAMQDLDVPGLRSLYLKGKVEVIGYQHATSDKLVRAMRHSIEKRRLSVRAEAAAKESETLARTMALMSEHYEGALLILDPSGGVNFVNSKAAALFGLHEHQMLGENFEDLISHITSAAPDEFGLSQPDPEEIKMFAWESTWLGEPSTFVLMKKMTAETSSSEDNQVPQEIEDPDKGSSFGKE